MFVHQMQQDDVPGGNVFLQKLLDVLRQMLREDGFNLPVDEGSTKNGITPEK